MAGGKETPRQKMIGMMYLVLTALLALNVSKSILDAFVAIEENTQKGNIVQVERGDGFRNEVDDEIKALKAQKGEDNSAKIKKSEFVLARMLEIDKATGAMIEKIDKIKVDIMKESGEAVDAAKDGNEESIIWTKYDKKKNIVLPGRMNLMAVQAKDQYDIPMHHIVGEDIKNPTGEGKKLWADLIEFRKKMVQLTGSYTMQEKTYSINPKAINTYKDNMDLKKQVDKMVKSSKINENEDAQALKDIYIELTKPERLEVHGVPGVHWIGATFDHSPLVAALASLSSLQQNILAARSIAMRNWKEKVSTGEYSFNKVMPLAYGPAVVNNGDDVEIQVLMAAYDSDKNPEVVVTSGGTADITYKDGMGIVKLKAGSTSMEISGTVAIAKKSGAIKKAPWKQSITVMKPQGSIELPEMNVLYRGYPNKVSTVASGYVSSSLGAAGCTVKGASGGGYIVNPTTRNKTTKLSVSGKTADGKSVSLRSVEFRVKNLPDPSLYWGGKKSGDRGNKNSALLQAKYGPGIPLKADFTILSWSFQSPAANKPKKGTGGNIGAVSTVIRASKPGQQVGFVCTVRGPDGKTRKIGGTWTI